MQAGQRQAPQGWKPPRIGHFRRQIAMAFGIEGRSAAHEAAKFIGGFLDLSRAQHVVFALGQIDQWVFLAEVLREMQPFHAERPTAIELPEGNAVTPHPMDDHPAPGELLSQDSEKIFPVGEPQFPDHILGKHNDVRPGIDLQHEPVPLCLSGALQHPVGQRAQPTPPRAERILPGKPAIHRIPETIPEVPAAPQRGMRVVGAHLPTWRPDHPRHQHIDLETASMGMRADQRPGARLVRDSRIGHLEEQGQCLRHLIPESGVSRIERVDRHVVEVERHRRHAVAMLEAHRIDEPSRHFRVTHQQLGRGVAADQLRTGGQHLPDLAIHHVADHRLGPGQGIGTGMGRPAEDHLTPAKRRASDRSMATSRARQPILRASSIPDSAMAMRSSLALTLRTSSS